MKRYLSIILAALFLLTSVDVIARPLLAGNPVVFRDTITGLRVQTVNGVALIDNAGATVPTFADGNHSIEIYAAGLMLRGVLSTAGSGETLDTNVFATFDFTSGWNVNGPATVTDADTFTSATASGNGVYKQGFSPGLFKLSATGTGTAVTLNELNDTQGIRVEIADLNGAPAYYVPASIAGWSGLFYVRQGGIGTVDITALNLQQVLTPSTAGAVIVDAKGSATQNWGINQWTTASYNLASYQVVIRKLR